MAYTKEEFEETAREAIPGKFLRVVENLDLSDSKLKQELAEVVNDKEMFGYMFSDYWDIMSVLISGLSRKGNKKDGNLKDRLEKLKKELEDIQKSLK